MPRLDLILQGIHGFFAPPNDNQPDSVYLDRRTFNVDVYGNNEATDALTVRRLNPANNAPTTLFQVLKNGTALLAGIAVSTFSGAFSALTGTISAAQHGLLADAAAGHRHADLTAVTSDQHHAQLHATAHQPGGGDAMAVDAAVGTGSLRTLGTGATQAAVGTHTTPTATTSAGGHVSSSDKQQLTRQSVGNITGATTADFTAGTAYEATLTGNVTFAFTAPVAGSAIVVQLKQDATGARTVTWPAAVIWPGGTAPTLTTTANKVDIFSFYYDGTNYRGQTMGLNYA